MAPAKEQNNKPEEIRAALEALRLYKASGTADESYQQELKKYLPPLAMKMGKQGTAVTADALLAEIEQGPAHFQTLLYHYNNPASQKRTYEGVIKKLSRTSTPLQKFNDIIQSGDVDGLKDYISGLSEEVIQEAFNIAAVNGNLNMVEYLNAKGANIHDRNDYALRYASASGHLEVVKYLVKQGANIDASDWWPIDQAAKHGHLDTVHYLIAQADLSVSNSNLSWDKAATLGTALAFAAENAHFKVVKSLVKKGADIHAKGELALFKAAREGHLDMVYYLAEQGAVINEGALSIAARFGHLNIVKYFVEKGVDIHVQNDWPLRAAAEKGHVEIVKYLHEKGCDIRTRDNQALLRAAEGGHWDVVKYLLENGIDIQFKDNLPLYHAASQGSLEMVQYLVKKGADIHAGNELVLRRAIKKEQMGMAEYLVAQGADESVLDAVSKKALNQYRAWKNIHPEASIPEKIVQLSPHYFKPSAFEAVHAMLLKEGYTGSQLESYSYDISGLFGSEDRVLQYLEKWGKAGKQPLHEIAHMIQIPQEGRFDVKAWGDAVLQHGPKLAKFVKFAGKIPRPEKDAAGTGWSYTKTKDKIAEFAFEKGYKNPALASFCLDHGWDEDDFKTTLKQIKKYQKQYVANDNHKTAGRIPAVEMDGKDFGKDGYRFYKLPDGDIRGLLLGEFTNCCQHLANAGADCAKHGFRSEEGGFYVVADKKTDQIVGQSWAWRGEKDELVLDSLESLSGHFNAQSWENLLEKFARKALEDKKAAISAVHVGQGGATPELSFEKAASLAKPVDYSGYRDSEDDQYVVKPAGMKAG